MIQAGTKFGRLTLLEDCPYSDGSKKKVTWACDCGKTVSAIVKNVTRGGSSTCGKCSEVSAAEMLVRRFGRLRMKYPADIKPASHRKVAWVCDCGREIESIVNSVFSGQTVSCRRCNEVSAEEMANRKFGKLRMKSPEAITSGSLKRVIWLCDCGNETSVVVASVLRGATKSCTKCDRVSADEMSVRKFGRLRIEIPAPTMPGSNTKVSWVCNCGNQTQLAPYSVFSGGTKSCGKCFAKAHDWWIENRDIIRSLKCPIDPSSVPAPFRALETIVHKNKPFSAVCLACGNEYSPRFGNIRQGNSITCGCSYNKISSLSLIVRDILTSAGLESVLECEVGGLSYDVFVPKRNLLLELNGLHWHSFDGAKPLDRTKYENAISHGYDFMMIYEDEVHRPSFPDFLKNRVGATVSVSLRPSKCEIRIVDSSISGPFYDRNHYIGACGAKVHYGVFHGSDLVACASFSTPTRQTARHPWELVRMASDPAFRVHGVWSSLMRAFVREHSPTSVVSFSDNRMFRGGVYEKMGFRFDGDVSPDYFWTDSYKRFHKSGLRKKGAERTSGLTETQLRTAAGLRKIWDLGKKRWVWTASSVVF